MSWVHCAETGSRTMPGDVVQWSMRAAARKRATTQVKVPARCSVLF